MVHAQHQVKDATAVAAATWYNTTALKSWLSKKIRNYAPHKMAIKQSTQTSLSTTDHQNEPLTDAPFNGIIILSYDIILFLFKLLCHKYVLLWVKHRET